MKLRDARRSRLYSQRDLAKKAQVTASTIYLIENNLTSPRLSIMRRLSEALGVDAQEIDEFVMTINHEPTRK